MNREEATRKNLGGLKLLETGQYNKAIKLFSEAIEIDPNYAAPWLNRSEANRQLGREAEANTDKEKGKALMQATRTEVPREEGIVRRHKEAIARWKERTEQDVEERKEGPREEGLTVDETVMRAASFAISRKKQGVFWGAVGYTVLFMVLVVLGVLSSLGGGVDAFVLSFFIVVRLPVILLLLLVMPSGPISALVLIVGFTFLTIVDSLAIFLSGGVDTIITLPFALAGLVFAVRSYVKVQGKTKGHILGFVLMLVGGAFWVWYVDWTVSTFDMIIRGPAEAKSDAIQRLIWVVVMPIVWTVIGSWGSRRAKR